MTSPRVLKRRILLYALTALVFAIAAWLGTGTLRAAAQTEHQKDVVSVSVFVRDDCKHCRDEKAFLATLKSEMGKRLDLVYYDIDDPQNKELFKQVAQQYGLSQGTPITMVRNVLLQGYDTDQTTGRVIRELIERGGGENYRFTGILNGEATVYAGSMGSTCEGEEECVVEAGYSVRIPFTGRSISVGGFSLSALSLTLGFIDGFNPCALWVLIMFLIILSQIGSRRRMFQYAGLFIVAEAIMYYLILTVWFTAWDFIALNRIVTPLVGLLALGSGVYFVWRFANFKDECEVASPGQQKKLRERIKELSAKPMTLGVIAGILMVAFSVNVFEFACSIGIPQTFTKILELNELSFLGRQGYMLLYILMYMVDDLIVFGIALYSIEKIGLTHKYSRYATLVGGLLMLLLGAIMLLKPELLVF